MNEDVYQEYKQLAISRIQDGTQWIFAYNFTQCEIMIISKRLNITDDIETKIVDTSSYRHQVEEIRTYKTISSKVVFSYLDRLIIDFDYGLFAQLSETENKYRGNRGIKNLSRPLKAFATDKGIDKKGIDKKGLIANRTGLYTDRYLATMFKLTT